MNKQYLSKISNFNFVAEDLVNKLEIGVLIATVIIILIFIFLSIILDYHWKNQGVTKAQIKHLQQIYFGVSGALLVGLLVGLLFFIL